MKAFDPELMKIVCKSEAILYPLMLPKVPFDSGIDRNVRRRYILPSEEWYIEFPNCSVRMPISVFEHFQYFIIGSWYVV